MPSNDWTLLERWSRERDAEAFAELAARYAGVIYGACRRVLGDSNEAEDAAQECLLTLAQTRVPPHTNLAAWLHRVAVNKSRDRVKASSRRRDREQRYMKTQPTETVTQWREIEALVDEAIADLPIELREVVVAHFMLSESQASVAERLGVSRQTVTNRVGKGVERIREALRQRGVPIAATTLVAGLAANLAEAAPATLVASAGKMAVSGVPAGTAAAGAMALKYAVLGLSVCAIGYTGYLASGAFVGREVAEPVSEAPIVREVVAPEPAPQLPMPEPAVPEPVPEPEAAAPVPEPEPEPEPAPPPVVEEVETPAEKPAQPMLSGASGGKPSADQYRVRVVDPNGPEIPLPLELPQPYFGGTPLDYFGENLEERSYKPREPLMVPAGTINLAAGKPVTSSDPNPNYGKLEFVTDGEKGYQQDYLVELDTGVQWVQIDLGEVSEIYAIVVWHFHAAERIYFDVVVKTADDAEFTEDVRTVYNNDHDDSSGLGAGKDKEYVETYEGRLIPLLDQNITGRYVRLYTNGNTSDEANHYVEVEVYGVPGIEESG
ncbi:MAG: sigma-70 family RNA polymerase sigma factor [Bryobacteraceae bacterium]|nr:sigma-70 family RNA polymerase sigma factor [Bryobacteraceae bacterium]